MRFIAAVSGGSIAAAFVATRWSPALEADDSSAAFVRDVYESFRSKVTGTNIRNAWALEPLCDCRLAQQGEGHPR